MYKPVWYYSGNGISMPKSTIVGIGNPAIWWFGIISVLYSLYSTIKKHNQKDLFIIIFILATYIPYIFVGRIMFLYHFYITLPFVMLSVVSLINKLNNKFKSNIPYVFYISLVIVIFIIFYPVTTGKIINPEYIDNLKWLPSWIF